MHQKLVVLSCSLPHASHGFAQYSFTVCEILRGLAYLTRVLFNKFRTFFPTKLSCLPYTHHLLQCTHSYFLWFQKQTNFTKEIPEKRLLPHLSFEQMYPMTPQLSTFFFASPLPPSTDQKAPALRIITFPSEHVSKWQRAEEKLMLCLNLKRINAELG